GAFELKTVNPAAGNAPLTVGPKARVTVAGTWVNDTPSQRSLPLAPTWIDGGTIELTAAGDFVMQPGSWLGVSGGAQLTGSGQVVPGRGGLISLGSRSGSDTRFEPQGGLAGFALLDGGTLRFEGNALALYEAAPDAFLSPVQIPAPPN